MTQTFVTAADIAAVASVAIADQPTLLKTSYRNTSTDLSARGGGVVKIRKPITTSTSSFTGTGTYSAQDIEEGSTDLTVNRTFYQRFSLSPAELAMSIGDLNNDIITPACKTLMGDIEKYLLGVLTVGSGTFDHVAVSTYATLLDKIQILNESPIDGARFGFITPQTETTLMGLDAFANAAYRGSADASLAGVAGTVAGVRWARTNRLVKATAVTGTIKASADAAAGATSIVLKGITGAKITTGMQVTIGTAKYFVIEDATVTSNVATCKLDRGLAAALTADDAAALAAKNWNILMGSPEALAVGFAPLQPLPGFDSSVRVEEGIPLRVTLAGDVTTHSLLVTLECMLGAKVLVPEAIVSFIE